MEKSISANNKGTAFGVGVGPGDPELMTLKAVRLIRENEIIAVPGKTAEESVAFRIAKGAVPEIGEKTILPVCFPMIKDRDLLHAEHVKIAQKFEDLLDQGRNIVFLTLGDPTVYCTFSYIQHILEADGYPVELVSGITSFTGAAARLGMPLVEWNEPLHIIPAVHKLNMSPDEPGTYVFMKSASRMDKVKEILRESGRSVTMVENCGMPGEKIYRSVFEIPDDAGYFSLIIAK